MKHEQPVAQINVASVRLMNIIASDFSHHSVIDRVIEHGFNLLEIISMFVTTTWQVIYNTRRMPTCHQSCLDFHEGCTQCGCYGCAGGEVSPRRAYEALLEQVREDHWLKVIVGDSEHEDSAQSVSTLDHWQGVHCWWHVVFEGFIQAMFKLLHSIEHFC